MIVASETNQEDIMRLQLVHDVTAIIHNSYKPFVRTAESSNSSSKKFASTEDAADQMILINKDHGLPISDAVKIEIVNLLKNVFLTEHDAADFFESYARNHKLHPISKEKTLELLTTEYENLYVREELLGSRSSQRLALASQELCKKYSDHV